MKRRGHQSSITSQKLPSSALQAQEHCWWGLVEPVRANQLWTTLSVCMQVLPAAIGLEPPVHHPLRIPNLGLGRVAIAAWCSTEQITFSTASIAAMATYPNPNWISLLDGGLGIPVLGGVSKTVPSCRLACSTRDGFGGVKRRCWTKNVCGVVVSYRGLGYLSAKYDSMFILKSQCRICCSSLPTGAAGLGAATWVGGARVARLDCLPVEVLT